MVIVYSDWDGNTFYRSLLNGSMVTHGAVVTDENPSILTLGKGDEHLVVL